MGEDLLALFTMPVSELSGWQRAGLLLPLTASISIIYKTLKCQTVREIPAASFLLWITIVAGMYLVGFALMIIYEILA